MKRENKAVAASDGARRPKRAFQLAEAAPAAAAEDIRLGRKTEREVGNREDGSIEQCSGPPRATWRATEGEKRFEMKNQIPLKDGKNFAATAAAAEAAEAGAKSCGRRPTSQAAAAAAAVTIICPSPPRPMHAAAAAVPEASAARAHSYLDS